MGATGKNISKHAKQCVIKAGGDDEWKNRVFHQRDRIIYATH